MIDGRLVSWTLDGALASGLARAAQGELVEIEGSGPALVTALRRDHVELAPLSSRVPSSGATVRAIGPLVTPAGEDLIGRTIDCLGNALDAGPEVARDEPEPIFARDPLVIAEPGVRRLTLGTLVYDLQRVIPMGASLLAYGPREVVHHLLRHQVAMGRVVVIATPAMTASSQLALRRGERPAQLTGGERGRPAESSARGRNSRSPRLEPIRCVHVAAGTGATPAQQWLVPWTALAIAARLRARGRDVVVAVDDLDAWKPHVRCSARGAWPAQLAQLASRAYATAIGSVSLIALTHQVSVTRAAAFDAMLELGLASRGELPVTGTKLVRPPIRIHSMRRLGAVCVAAARLAELAGAKLDHSVPARSEARRYRECLRVRIGATIDSLEQELCLIAIGEQRDVPAHRVAEFAEAYLARLRRDHAGMLAAIREANEVSADREHALLAVAASVATGFTAGTARDTP